MNEDPRVIRIKQELERYQHPLLRFDARATGPQAELLIALKVAGFYDHAYAIKLSDREIGAKNFAWRFQSLLYSCVHDYLIEMFERTPQTLPEK